jgi:hypothetical protein
MIQDCNKFFRRRLDPRLLKLVQETKTILNSPGSETMSIIEIDKSTREELMDIQVDQILKKMLTRNLSKMNKNQINSRYMKTAINGDRPPQNRLLKKQRYQIIRSRQKNSARK